MKMQKNTKFYVICPAHTATGGTELLHQLVHELLNLGAEAYLVYNKNNQFIEEEIPFAFQKYNLKITAQIEDNQNNVVVFPEVYYYLSRKFKKTKFLFWWLSVDNYYSSSSSFFDYLKFYLKGKVTTRAFLGYVKRFFSEHYRIFGFTTMKQLQSRAFHAYQSSYASFEIAKNNIFNQIKLTDYINQDYVKYYQSSFETKEKKDIVLYNPLKGYKFTRKIIEKLPNIEFFPLKGLTREQMVEKLQTAKLYIDFGNHPGMDRIPREACINGCCVITGRRGSAKFFNDVSIPKEYKFDENQLDEIVLRIQDILNNYQSHTKKFDYYREKIAGEYERFQQEVRDFYEVMTI